MKISAAPVYRNLNPGRQGAKVAETASSTPTEYVLQQPMGTVTVRNPSRFDAAGYRAVGNAKMAMLTSGALGGITALIVDAFSPHSLGGFSAVGGAGLSMAMAVPVALGLGACAGAVTRDPRPDEKISATIGLAMGACIGYLIGQGG